jgi:CRP-like cAMP-binding protein
MSLQTENATPIAKRRKNGVLSGLRSEDVALLAPHLQLLDLPRDHRLERRARTSDFVYFIERGVACAIVGESPGEGVEVGMIGREGFAGLAPVMGEVQSAYDTQMLAAGAAYRIPGAKMRDAMKARPSLQRAMHGYVYRFMLQAMRQAHVNARLCLDKRLVRWLLMMHDRVEGDDLQLTHDRLAALLGVRRAGVSVAAKKLERDGLISLHRGAIRIVERTRLEDACKDGYGPLDRQAMEMKTQAPFDRGPSGDSMPS